MGHLVLERLGDSRDRLVKLINSTAADICYGKYDSHMITGGGCKGVEKMIIQGLELFPALESATLFSTPISDDRDCAINLPQEFGRLVKPSNAPDYLRMHRFENCMFRG